MNIKKGVIVASPFLYTGRKRQLKPPYLYISISPPRLIFFNLINYYKNKKT